MKDRPSADGSPVRAVWGIVPRVGVVLLAGVSACGPPPERLPRDAATGDWGLAVVRRVDHLDGIALREPMVVEHPSGVLFVAGYSRAPEEAADPPNLYRSSDGGESWTPVDVGTVGQGARGNSDVDLAVGPEGVLYFLSMSFDRSVGEGTGISIGISRDVGATWTWTQLSEERFDDRPWVAVTPGGTAHVVWNDGSGVCHAVSDDAGASWEERPRIADRGGSSHLAVGPSGELAVRIAPLSASGNRIDEEVDRIAISVDGGVRWESVEAPGERVWSRPGPPEAGDVPRWVEPLAWGEDGTLHSLWSEGRELWWGRSEDRGRSWETRVVVEGGEPVYYPLLVAGGAGGELAATWFSGDGDALRAHVALLPVAVEPLPEIRPIALEPNSFVIEDGTRGADPAGEYFPALFLGGGGLGVVLPIQNAAEGDGFSWLRLSRRAGDESRDDP